MHCDRRREHKKKRLAKNRKYMQDLQAERVELLGSLKDLVARTDPSSDEHARSQALIKRVCHTCPLSDDDHSDDYFPTPDRSRRGSFPGTSKAENPEHKGSGDKQSHSSTEGSWGSQQDLAEPTDFDYGNGMPGYVGKMATSAWIIRVRDRLGMNPPSADNIESRHLQESRSPNYFHEDQNLLAIDEDHVHPYTLPTWMAAQVLTEAYFESLQDTFQFVQRKTLIRDLAELYRTATSTHTVPWPKRRFLALLNMIWAVGAKWLQVTGLNRHSQNSDFVDEELDGHLIYYARARALGLDHRMALDNPDLTVLQGMSVLTFYLIMNSSIHRAWAVCAQTVRYAIGLGLHRRPSPKAFSTAEIHQNLFTWWSIFRLEVLLSEITGRPTSLNVDEISTSLERLSDPTARLEDQTMVDADPYGDETFEDVFRATWLAFLDQKRDDSENLPDTHNADTPRSETDMQAGFKAAVHMSLLGKRIATRLYFSHSNHTWPEAPAAVRGFELHIAECSRDLPREHPKLGSNTSSRSAALLSLEMYLCSLQMVLYRPFIRDYNLTEKPDEKPDEKPGERAEFCRRCTRAGLQAALRMTEVLPDEAVAAYVLKVLPWWMLTHYMSQVVAVILLSLCLQDNNDAREHAPQVVQATTKAMNCLAMVAPASRSAYRAWKILTVLLRCMASRGIEFPPMEEAPAPPDWSSEDEASLHDCLVSLGLVRN
ncbi:uncharacterized protein HMPREF1541_10480 [Cyphellophora europaea CBS 101466]|uniref:Xylanolytic transcriptional activator regulatory domain-containing protein n=1 Tax=Cyphellophora europaea (strain CBS 101466) TaxID=1220924 RepID=W2S6P1_CYPE1|nr:uncharacterized protein HMPREF1541_10480 [Cyphellophora europaea CBS 101466]ETN44300.1 hypothetical protein HMPREF1541_10480 [Cyphellophora europaea CBS 101466]